MLRSLLPLMKNILTLVFSLLCLLACSQRKDGANADEVDRTDSLLSASNNLLFASPLRADSLYRSMQKGIADSTAWYRVEVFRGTAYRFAGDSAASERHYDRAEAWCRRQGGNPAVEGLLWNHRALMALSYGNTDKALAHYEKAHALLSRSKGGRDLLAVDINLADLYLQQGDMVQSARLYREALFICDSLHDASNRPSICDGLAAVYMELNNFPLAHHYFSQAGEHIGSQPANIQLFHWSTLGNCYYFEEKYDSAYQSFAKALACAEQLNGDTWRLTCHANMGEVRLMQDRLDEAEKHFALCRKLLDGGLRLPSATQFYLKSLFADLCIARGRKAEAKRYLSEATDTVSFSSPRYLMLHYRRLQHYAARSGNWREAYAYQQQSLRHEKSLNNRQFLNNVAEISSRYQRDTTLLRQRYAIAEYAAQTSQQKNFILLLVLSVIVLAAAGAGGILVYRRTVQRRMERQLERIAELRMCVVRNRVSPHYIFNVLGTIVPQMQQFPNLEHSVELLIDVLRGNLLMSDKRTVALCDEIRLVKKFVELHHLSRSEWPVVTWAIDEHLRESQLPVPSMSLQIPVENALKHAFAPLTAESRIHIDVTETGGCLTLRVTDNGQGYNPGKIKRTGRDTGTGLKLMNYTFDILNRYNARKASLRIASVPPPHTGTTVEIVIPTGYRYDKMG